MSQDIFKTSEYGKGYLLFGETVRFSDSAERFYDLIDFMMIAQMRVTRAFEDWYRSEGNIEDILYAYPNFSARILISEVIQPLFNQLSSCEIYDVSEQSYKDRCLNTTNSASAYQRIRQKYEAILREQQAEQDARAMRKETRGRWQGGGFGLSGAIKGAITAGALNAVSGIGHSMANAVGNSFSAIGASIGKHSLFGNDETPNTLLDGVIGDVAEIVDAHINLLNEHFPNYVVSSFEMDKADALFANAKQLPDKRSELLLQAVQFCPWNEEILSYVFINFEQEREPVSALAKRFHVDLSEFIEAAIKNEYDAVSKTSLEAFAESKQKVLSIMQKYSVSESPTLDRLDTDCLRFTCDNGKKGTIGECDELIRSIEAYDTRSEIKTAFLQEINQQKNRIWDAGLSELCEGCEQADEAACKEMLSAIEGFDAPEERKKPFADRVQAYIEKIWSAEDGEIFDNVYLETDLHNPEVVAAAIEYIRSKGRTDAALLYLNALNGCSEKNIKKARKWQKDGHQTALLATALVLLIIGIVTIGGPGILFIIASIVCFIKRAGNKKAWKLLTLNGRHIHPALTEPASKKKKK